MFYHWLAPLGKTYIIFNLFNYISFRAAGATVTALLARVRRGPAGHRAAACAEGGSDHPRRGPREPSDQARHADHGRADHHHGHGGADAALGAAHQPLRRRGDALDSLDGMHRVPGRLPQDRAGEVARAGGQVEAGGAGELRAPARAVPDLLPRGAAGNDPRHCHDAAVLQVPGRQLRALAVRGVRNCGHHRRSNAVNLTDGLDGLATGLAGISAAAFATFAYLFGRVDVTSYLNLFYLPGAGELAVFCAALMGAAIGFLWFNAHPAEVFMGDTGSLAIGGALGTVAILLKAEFLLLLIGGVFAAEAVSVILQTSVFKWYKRTRGREYADAHRVFRMAPLHHHFEKLGWAETTVVTRFYILGLFCALVALSTLKVR